MKEMKTLQEESLKHDQTMSQLIISVKFMIKKLIIFY